jgi:hypothetical protein
MKSILRAFALVVIFSASIAAAYGTFFQGALFRSAATSTVFTPTATYFMAASGCSDANNGLTIAAPWCTVNHAVNCGDVIIANSGTYNGSFSSWGTVSNCPSTTAGIDGTGGVYFATLLCSGNLGGCLINCSTGACNAGGNGASAGMNVGKSNWAVEGWAINGNGSGHLAFVANACLSTTTIIHHVAFVNNLAWNTAVGYGAQDCGLSTPAIPGNGVDYWAVVGNDAQNANLIAICSAAIVNVGPTNSDTNAGVHNYIASNFIRASSNNPSCSASDGEAIMFDTFDAHGMVGFNVIENNIVFNTSWVGIQVFMQAFNSAAPTFDINHNTLYNNMLCPRFQPGSSGDINLQLNSNFPWTITTYNNLSRVPTATQSYGVGCGSTATNHSYSMLTSPAGGSTTITTGGTGLENIFRASSGACDNGVNCNGTDDVIAYNSGVGHLGTNIYSDPAYTNTSDLTTNWIGVASCGSYFSVARCMGYNGTSANALSVIGDLIPTLGGSTGSGYQLPTSHSSNPNSTFPTWLKGMVCLQVSGGFINAATINQTYDCARTPSGY